MIRYPAIFFKDGDYIGVEFPDLPGCFSQGKDFDDAAKNASKALGKFLGEINFYPEPEDIDLFDSRDIKMIEPTPDVDETHSLMINPISRCRIVFPNNQEFLGDKLSEKICALGVSNSTE